MEVGFRQWESDPLFSAAEVVQDSADRMDSIFRIFGHEQSLVQDDPTDRKLLSSMEYHKRDLATALGTTKWQLEDFERAVNISTFSDKTNMREDIISRHKQFIRAIEEQIVQVERSLGSSAATDSESSTQWMNSNEKDSDGLALFLSGGYPENHTTQHNNDSSIMSRFLDATKASDLDEKSNEIIELKSEEIEEARVNGVMHIDHSFDNLKKSKLRKVGSNYHNRPGFETSIMIEDENNDSNAKSIFSKNRLRGPHSKLDVFSYLNNFWSVYGGKIVRTFAKRRNGAEVRKDQILSSSYIDIPQAEQGILMNRGHIWSWAGDCRRQVRRLYQSEYSDLLQIVISVILIILFVLGFMFCLQVWGLYTFI
ncbi:hypothetical protein AQUCO_07200130v1 [Aquilegia coerulea]|uniref:Syntaxin 6/10/61 N-terminal domain-containing protein n=1 Tax=Aquilegia coerulea TaxID=218851 RepID=A0A2G5CAG1_AQUCA|nr:hypothetical protein AQUCO_07200130v1 [Aquilegia coerulea]